MPIHDWSRVEAGIFHHFHHRWISAISDVLNAGLLPADYYALAEQFAGGFGPDVLNLQTNDASGTPAPAGAGGGGLLVVPPKVKLSGETDMEFYRRRQKAVVIRHVSGDRVVAMVEVVSPGNKAGRHALRPFVDKAAEFLDRGIHLLVLDLLPPTRRDPHGIHVAIWEELTGKDWSEPLGKPLTLVSYEAGLTLRWYVEPVAVGDTLPEMPLFLQAGAHVLLPLEATYQTAWQAVPRRWQRVLDDGRPEAGAHEG
jgi:hypothetical protein